MTDLIQIAKDLIDSVPDPVFYPTTFGAAIASILGAIPVITSIVVLIVAILKGMVLWEDWQAKRSKRLDGN